MFGHKTGKYAGEETVVDLVTGKSTTVPIKQCVHCGTHWTPQPGSGNRRGWCYSCHGDICSELCSQYCYPFEKMMEDYERIENNVLRELQGYGRFDRELLRGARCISEPSSGGLLHPLLFRTFYGNV